MPKYQEFYKGIAESRRVQSGFDDIQNGDIHSELGAFVCQKALVKKSGTTVDKPVYFGVAPSGDAYLFSQIDGAVFKRAISNGAYSTVRTGTNGAHRGARYYNGYIYYSMNDKLGRFDLATTWNDNFQNLTASYAHPLEAFDLILYIGNGRDIAQLDDAGVFTSSALDLPLEYHVTALAPLGDDLLTLANPGDYINQSAVFRWNTYGDSWSVKDAFYETNAYAFVDADNYKYVATNTGKIWFYNGNQLEIFTEIRNPAATAGHQLTTNFGGKSLIANGGKIYSIHRKNRNMPIAMACEFTCSAGADATIYESRLLEKTFLSAGES